MADNLFKEYGIEYAYKGKRWGMSVMATSPEDAMARIRQAAAFGECYTPEGIAFEVPVGGAWLTRLLNLCRRIS